MDINLLKHSLFSEEIVFNDTSEQNVDVSLNLPDYCKSIKKILKCKAIPRQTSKGINGQSAFIDGTICLNILYVDDTNCLQSFEHTVPISKTFDIKNTYENCNIVSNIKCEYINCKAVNERKFEINGSASIYIEIKVINETHIISDVDNNVELLKDYLTATMPIGQGEKNLIVEEEISIGNGQMDVESLLRYETIPIIDESKIINNKVIVKGTLKVYVLYSSHDGTRPHNFSYLLPFSQIVDIEGVHEGCKCDCNAQIMFSELKPITNEEECRSFLLTSKILIYVNAYGNNQIPLIFDAYSTNYNADVCKSDISVISMKENFNDKFIAKKLLEFSDDAIGSIIDMWCDCQVGGYKIENNNIIINGKIIAQILAYDIDGVPNYYERPIDFEYRYEINEQSDLLDCKFVVNIYNSSFTITGPDKIEITIELILSGILYDLKRCSVLTDIKLIDEKKDKNANDCAIIIYFGQSGEKLWDIAKRYNSSQEEIMVLNNCSENYLIENRGLIIPIK